MLGLLTAMSLLGPKVSLCIVEPFALAWLGPFALEWLEPFALETLGPFALRVLVSFALWTLGPSFPSWTGGSPVRGGGWFINSQTRPLHASEGDETRRQGSDSP